MFCNGNSIKETLVKLLHFKMEIQFLDPTAPSKRTLKKIPGKQEDRSVINHEELAKIISFERRDIVCDVLKVFLRFMKEVNMMANFGGEEIDWDPSKDPNLLNQIVPLPKDVHPRQIGIAFFSFASNIVANWEEAYLKASIEFMKSSQTKQTERSENSGNDYERQDLEELEQTSSHSEQPHFLQNESKHFQDAFSSLRPADPTEPVKTQPLALQLDENAF